MFTSIIERIKQTIGSLKGSLPTALFYILLAAVGIFVTWFTYNYAILFSDFGLIILFLVICLGFYHLFDRVILKEIDFTTEIKSNETNPHGNIAYALVLIAVAIIILAGAITIG